jgi:molybdate transport system substrate-binding protein
MNHARLRTILISLIVLPGLFSWVSARAGDIDVAVAANFTSTIQTVAKRFETETGNRVSLSFGSTGKLYAQIVHGAPYDIFLAADKRRPRLLEANGEAVAGSRFTYARGRLALWQPGAKTAKPGRATLEQADFAHLAIANPKTAPYGLAAQQTLQHLGLWKQLEPRLVYGENIAQTYQFVASGNAPLGFVALSQVMTVHSPKASYWVIPENLHAPIEQQAVLLKRANHNATAAAFLNYLKTSTEARRIIEAAGYSLP